MVELSQISGSVDQWLAVLKKKSAIKDLVGHVIEHPDIIPLLIDIINIDKRTVKYACEKIIRQLSEREPTLIYPYFDDIARLLDHPNNFIKWGSVITLANLAAVDRDNRFDGVFERFFALLDSDSMIAAANVISHTAGIILARPDREAAITARLFDVNENIYINKGKPSPECKNILQGQLLDCFDKYFAISGSQPAMLAFATDMCSNARKTVAKKATVFLKKHSPD